jgi:hypothetical protein
VNTGREPEAVVTVALGWSRRSPEVRFRTPAAALDRWMAVAAAYDLTRFPLLTASSEDRIHRSEFAVFRQELDQLCRLLNDPALHGFAAQVGTLLTELQTQRHDPDAYLLISWGDPLEWHAS